MRKEISSKDACPIYFEVISTISNQYIINHTLTHLLQFLNALSKLHEITKSLHAPAGSISTELIDFSFE